MDYFLTFFNFVIKSFDMPFVFSICTIIGVSFIYLILYILFETDKTIKAKKKHHIKNFILKVKSKKYGIKPEILAKINNKQHLKI